MASREEKKAATRKKLLDAAASIVAKDGAMAASLDSIAEKAGLTKGAVYSNFGSKEELLEALADRAGPSINNEELFDPDLSLADNLELVGRAVAESLTTVSRRAWQLGLELYHYALRNPRFRRRYAAEYLQSNAVNSAYFHGYFSGRGESSLLTPAELDVVMNALAIGLAQRRQINPTLVPDVLFAKAFRLLAS
jgi:AcrR family transcriptional regulator